MGFLRRATVMHHDDAVSGFEGHEVLQDLLGGLAGAKVGHGHAQVQAV
jgi:hypothetical protein